MRACVCVCLCGKASYLRAEVAVTSRSALPPAPAAAAAPPAPVKLVGGLREIAAGELRKHTTRESCWVLLHGKVYDFTHFLDEHPAGAEAILRQAGGDASEIFDAIHSQTMLDDFKPIGVLAASA